MRQQRQWTCAQHASPHAYPDAFIVYDPRFGEYGLIIHDGGRSSVSIAFCPWCGTRLPASLRDRWFEEMEALGVDPWSDDIPEAYRSGAWQGDVLKPGG